MEPKGTEFTFEDLREHIRKQHFELCELARIGAGTASMDELINVLETVQILFALVDDKIDALTALEKTVEGIQKTIEIISMRGQ